MKHKDSLRNSIWKLFKKGGTHKLVMLFLAEKEAGLQTVVTIDEIAKACSVSERQAQYVMKDLIESGHVAVIGNNSGGFSLPRIYKVFANPKRVKPVAPKKGEEFSTLEGCSGLHPHIYMFTKGEHNEDQNHPSQGANCFESFEREKVITLAGARRVAA